MKKEDFKTFLFFKKGKIRKQVLDSLNTPKTATEVAKELSLHRSSVSRVLIELEKKGLIKCLNPEDKSFRHYTRK